MDEVIKTYMPQINDFCVIVLYVLRKIGNNWEKRIGTESIKLYM